MLPLERAQLWRLLLSVAQGSWNREQRFAQATRTSASENRYFVVAQNAMAGSGYRLGLGVKARFWTAGM